MKAQFFELVDTLSGELRAGETLLCTLSGEKSDFIRFNHARVRQAGQRRAALGLAAPRPRPPAGVGRPRALGRRGRPRARARTRSRACATCSRNCPKTRGSSSPRRRSRLRPSAAGGCRTRTTSSRRWPGPRATRISRASTRRARSTAASRIRSGQRNWHEVDTFNFDWSVHLAGDKAVKEGYAGFDWDAAVFETKLRESVQRLELMRRPPRTLDAGRIPRLPRAARARGDHRPAAMGRVLGASRARRARARCCGWSTARSSRRKRHDHREHRGRRRARRSRKTVSSGPPACR